MKEIESWQNGEWIPNSKIGTKLWDAHFFFGYAVFDAFRTYDHKLHMLDCHINRLYKSAKLVDIDIGIEKYDLIKKVKEVMNHNKEFFEDDEYRFMIFVSPGFFKIYDDMGKTQTILTINTTTTSRYAKHIYPYIRNGLTSVITNQQQIPFRFLDSKIKSCSRLHYGLADVEAKKYSDNAYPILLDEFGYIAESSGSNVGFIKNNNLYFPDSKDMLEGCTMKFIERISNKVELNFKKGSYTPYDLIDCDCILYTSTFSGILPSYTFIHKGNTYQLNKDKGHKIFDKLMIAFSNEVGVDIYNQWRNWYLG